MVLSSRVLWVGKLTAASLVVWFCVVYFESLFVSETSLTGLVRPTACDPFFQHGILEVDTWNLQKNRWLPLSDRCKASNMLIPTLQASWDIQAPRLEQARKEFDPVNEVEGQAQTLLQVERLRGKTAVLFGDSLSRGNVFQFCELFGELPIVIRNGHPYYPGDPGEEYPVINGTTSFPRITPPSDPCDWSDPVHDSHYCYVPALDLMVLQVFNFGMDEEFYWKGREPSKPYLFEYRMSWTAKATVQRMGRGEPDLLLMGSALWDSAKWMREDLQSDADPHAGLTTERVRWYRQRVREVLESAQKTFPRTTRMWMANHYPARNDFSSWFVGDVSGNKRPANKINRLFQMNAAARSVIDDEHAGNAGIFLWGQLMLGQESHQMDDLHTTLMPGGVLFAEMLLYYLYHI